MASRSVLLFSLLCWVCTSVTVSSQLVLISEPCYYNTPKPTTVHCFRGQWPHQSISFSSNVTSIMFRYMVFQSDAAENIQPLPATLTSLKQLHFSNVTSVNQTGVALPTFPLQRLTGNVNRANISTLSFTEVQLLEINKQFLAGFTGLESLSFAECAIGGITTNAFESLSTLTTNTVSGMLEARSVFKRLYLEKNIQIKRFPWEALTYVSSSLEGVKISRNPNLTDITFSPINSGNVIYPPMNRLHSVQITGNPYLSALPETILTSGNGMGIVRPHTSFISFAGNGNQCEGCALKSMIAWAAELSDATAADPRNLWADCRVDCTDTLFGVVPRLAGWPTGLRNATFWATFEAKFPSTCRPFVTRPCAEEYDSPVTTARTTRFVPTDGGPNVHSSSTRNASGSRKLIFVLPLLLLFRSVGMTAAAYFTIYT